MTLNKTEKMIIDQLPVRFEALAQTESKPQAPLPQRVRNFRKVITQVFEPVIQMLMKADRKYITGLVKKKADGKKMHAPRS